MKAIIMAGGEGTRLRPLTCDCPKPMIRLMNRPVMQYALALLKQHGVTQVAATLGYLPDAIADYFGDGDAFGVDARSLHVQPGVKAPEQVAVPVGAKADALFFLHGLYPNQEWKPRRETDEPGQKNP